MNELMNRARMQQFMEERDLDGVIAASPQNVLYCTGMYSLSQWLMVPVKAYGVVPRDPKLPIALVLPISDVDLAAETPPRADRLHPYGVFYVEPGTGSPTDASDARLRELALGRPAASPGDALTKALAEYGAAFHRLGWDESAMDPEERGGLEAALADIEFRPASELLSRTRMVKTDAEQKRLQRSAAITESAMMTVIDNLREGMTELDARRIFERVLVDAGARPGLIVIGFGDHSAYPNATPGDRKLKPGDIVRFDVGCTWNHYWSDLSRCAVFGEPTERIRAYYAALVRGEDAAIEAVRPGAKASEVFDHAMRAVQAHGIPQYRRQHVGHGIGLEVYDPPILRPGVDTVLEPGMVLNVETPYYEVGFGGLQIEDLLVVTEDGCQLLTTTDRKLYVKEATPA